LGTSFTSGSRFAGIELAVRERKIALLQPLDPLRLPHLAQLRGDLERIGALRLLYARKVGLREVGGVAAEGHHDLRRHTALDQLLAGRVYVVELFQEHGRVGVGEVEGEFHLFCAADALCRARRADGRKPIQPASP
jgi:hypothetical protein